MPENEGVALSPAMASALHDFRPLLEPDDLDRTQALESAASETLAAMIEAVEPLYPEINSPLDRPVSQPASVAGGPRRTRSGPQLAGTSDARGKAGACDTSRKSGLADFVRRYAPDDYPDLPSRLLACRRAAWRCGSYLRLAGHLPPGSVSETAVVSSEGADEHEEYGIDLDEAGQPVGVELLHRACTEG